MFNSKWNNEVNQYVDDQSGILDESTRQLVNQLSSHVQQIEPTPEFVEALSHRLQHHARETAVSPSRWRVGQMSLLPAMASLLFIFAVSAFAWGITNPERFDNFSLSPFRPESQDNFGSEQEGAGVIYTVSFEDTLLARRDFDRFLETVSDETPEFYTFNHEYSDAITAVYSDGTTWSMFPEAWQLLYDSGIDVGTLDGEAPDEEAAIETGRCLPFPTQSSSRNLSRNNIITYLFQPWLQYENRFCKH